MIGSTTSDYAQVHTDSPATYALMAAAWAGAALLWVVVNARMKPTNSSFGWRALSVTILVCCGAQCAVNVLAWSGDTYTAATIDFASKLIGLIAVASAGARVVTVNKMCFSGVGHRHELDDTLRHSTPVGHR